MAELRGASYRERRRSTGEKQYDQKYGEPITGGIGRGSESTAQIQGPSIDASLLSYPLNSSASKGGQYLYELVQKIVALVTNADIQVNTEKDNVDSNSNPNKTMSIYIKAQGHESYKWNGKVYHEYPFIDWRDSIIKVCDTVKIAKKYKKVSYDTYIDQR